MPPEGGDDDSDDGVDEAAVREALSPGRIPFGLGIGWLAGAAGGCLCFVCLPAPCAWVGGMRDQLVS